MLGDGYAEISVNHMDHWPTLGRVAQLSNIYETTLKQNKADKEGRNYNNNDCFAVMSVGKALAELQRVAPNGSFSICATPFGRNVSHADIFGLDLYRDTDPIMYRTLRMALARSVEYPLYNAKRSTPVSRP